MLCPFNINTALNSLFIYNNVSVANLLKDEITEIYFVPQRCYIRGVRGILSWKNVTCSAIWGLLDTDDDLKASHELLNTERIL